MFSADANVGCYFLEQKASSYIVNVQNYISQLFGLEVPSTTVAVHLDLLEMCR